MVNVALNNSHKKGSNRTGPEGNGPMTGGRSGKGLVRCGGRNKDVCFGPGGYYICAKCGEKVPQQQNVKCTKKLK